MPLRDFTCQACGQAFEKLVRGDEAIACPACGATELRREMSAFAVGAGGSAPQPTGCGGCGMNPANCGFEAGH